MTLIEAAEKRDKARCELLKALLDLARWQKELAVSNYVVVKWKGVK